MAMKRFFTLAALLFSATPAFAGQTRTVNCDAGQSLTLTLATLVKFLPATVTVKGTCTEYVLVDGFNNLTLVGAPGATLQQPSEPPTSAFVLSIEASRSVTVAGLAFRSLPSVLSSIGIGGGSNEVLVRDVTTDGSGGIFVYEASQVRLVRVTVNITSNYAAIWAVDKSDVHIVDGLLQRPANSTFNANANLVVSNSKGQGVIVSNDSHARLSGSSITGGAHGGLVVTNLSTASVDFNFFGNPSTTITANGTDVFCDSKSRITGGASIANAITVNCSSLLPGSYENLP